MKKDTVFRGVIVAAIAFIVYFFGIKPFITGDIFFERSSSAANWAKGASDKDPEKYDVVVYGEEPEGIAAAVSAARLGARVLLLSEGEHLGGSVAQCLLTGLDIPRGPANEILNGGLLAELNHKLGKDFSAEWYLKIINSLVKNEKNIDVVYQAGSVTADIDGESLKSIQVKVDGKQEVYRGSMFIDASRSGELLDASKIPCFTGSGDLHLEHSYMPVKLNFEMKGADSTPIKTLMSKDPNTVYSALKGYRPNDVRTRINDFQISVTGTETIVIRGLELAGVDVEDGALMKEAYGAAVKEAHEIAGFLADKVPEFKDWKISKSASRLYVPEYRHFSGLVTLGVNDALENRYFDSTIAMGSLALEGGKFTEGRRNIIGKPVQYGIPLGCIVSSTKTNLMMVGPKASYSSLAATSAGTLGTGIAAGEAAGLVSVYSLLKHTTPGSLEKLRKLEDYDDIRKYLNKQNFYLPRQKLNNSNDTNWSYAAARQLVSLGLLAGGNTNELGFDRKAVQSDLAILLLNGIYRVNPDKYSLELDSKIRTFFTKDPLTREGAGKIIAALYGLKGAHAYEEGCQKGYINEIMQLRLKDKKILTMDDVYYLATYNIRGFTGMEIKD